MRLIVMGTGPFAVPTFRSLLDSSHEILALVTRPVPATASRRSKPPANPMRDEALRHGLLTFDPEDVNAAESVEQLERWRADLLVVCDYGQILSRETISSTALGGINLHGSLLPKYRGAAPVNWAIWNGERETGVTVFHITPRVDGGPIVATRRTPIDPDETAVDVEARLAELGVEPVHESLARLANWDGETKLGELQDPSQATKAPRLKKQHGQVDWTRSAEQIRNQVRALKPWPGTYTSWQRSAGDTMRLILDWVSVADEPASGHPPGEVVVSDGKRLIVAAGEGTVSIDRIQPAGKRVMEIAEFLRGHPVPVGATLVPSDDARPEK